VSHSAKARVIVALLVGVMIAIDQLSKQWALSALGEVGSTVVLPGPLDLTLLFNYSSAFGLVPVSGGFTRWGLAALNLAVASILIRVVVQHTAMHLSTVALAFIIAGAIGNAVDRIRLGAVIDLFNASKLGFIWIFNVADVSIDIGIALLLLATVMKRSGYDRLFLLVAFRLFMSDVANAEAVSFAPAGPAATPGAVIPRAIPAKLSLPPGATGRVPGVVIAHAGSGLTPEGPEPAYVAALMLQETGPSPSTCGRREASRRDQRQSAAKAGMIAGRAPCACRTRMARSNTWPAIPPSLHNASVYGLFLGSDDERAGDGRTVEPAAARALGAGPRFTAYAGHHLVCPSSSPKRRADRRWAPSGWVHHCSCRLAVRTTTMAPTAALRAVSSSTICHRTSGCALISSSIPRRPMPGRRSSQCQLA